MYKVRYQEKNPARYANEKVTIVPGEDLTKDKIVEKLAGALECSEDEINLYSFEEVGHETS